MVVQILPSFVFGSSGFWDWKLREGIIIIKEEDTESLAESRQSTGDQHITCATNFKSYSKRPLTSAAVQPEVCFRHSLLFHSLALHAQLYCQIPIWIENQHCWYKMHAKSINTKHHSNQKQLIISISMHETALFAKCENWWRKLTKLVSVTAWAVVCVSRVHFFISKLTPQKPRKTV